MLEGRRIVVVLPAYNAAKTLRQTLDALPRQVVDEILLTDDASRDDTVNLSRSLGWEAHCLSSASWRQRF